MYSPLLAIVIGFILFVAKLDRKASIFLIILTGLLAHLLGFSTTLTIVSGFVFLLLLFKFSIALLLGGSFLLLSQLFGLNIALGIVSLSVICLVGVMILALSDAKDSIYLGVKDTAIVLVAVILGIFSRVINRIEIVGVVSSPNNLLQTMFSWYPGSEYAEKRREEFIKRGTENVKDGTVEEDKSAKELARDIRRAYDNAGKFLSNGEVSIALTLVFVSFIPLLQKTVDAPLWLTPPTWVGGVLTLILILAVRLRHAAFDAAMYQDVSADEERERLIVMSAWNQHLSNGAPIIKTLAEIRAIRTISEAAYYFYLDLVFERTLQNEEAGALALLHHWYSAFKRTLQNEEGGILTLLYHRRKFACVVMADLHEVPLSEASQNLFNRNIFESFEYEKPAQINEG